MAMRDAFRRAGINVPDEPTRPAVLDRNNDMTVRQEPQSRDSATCEGCGKIFVPRQAWHKQCDDCFRPRQRASSGPGGQPSRRERQRNPLPELPTSYFETDGKGNPCLIPGFVSKRTMDPLAQRLANAQPRLTTGQIRRFFNHCRQIEHRLKVDGETWYQVAATFESLSAHAQNASSGQNRKIPQEFQGFIDSNVRRVSAAADPRKAFLDGFMPHFEALVGFGAAYMRDR